MACWAWSAATALIIDGPALDMLPFIGCPSFSHRAPVVDVGYGTPREIAAVANRLPGAMALLNMSYEPFSTPVPHAYRLRDIAWRSTWTNWRQAT